MLSNKQESNTVRHKGDDLGQYMELISGNLSEKTQLTNYIINKPRGKYIEIGTGGDPLSEMIKNVPDVPGLEIYACDVDPGVLKLLIDRNPELNPFIEEKRVGTRLKTKVLNATKIDFPDCSIAGINMSAVFHEIHSYAGGEEGLEQAIKEVFRVLEDGGIMIYRDPEHVNGKEKIVEMDLKTKGIKTFTNIFLLKFLDREFTLKKDNEGKIQKPNVYEMDEVVITLHLKNLLEPITINFREYTLLPTNTIDFDKSIQLKAPLGLCNEIKRHYLTFLHPVNPLAFVKTVYNKSSNRFDVRFFANNGEKAFRSFCVYYNIQPVDQSISVDQKLILDEAINSPLNFLENGIPIVFKEKNKLEELQKLLVKNGFEWAIYIKPIQNFSNTYSVDSKIFNLFYEQLLEANIISNLNKPILKQFEEVSKWLKREGEEYYFYKSPDELLVDVAKITMSRCIDRNGNLKWFVLCPVNADSNYYIERHEYTNKLLDDYSINQNQKLQMREGKRVVHFAKLPLEQALTIYTQIIEKEPGEYVKLTKFIKNEFLPLLFNIYNESLKQIEAIQNDQYDKLY